MPVSIFLIVIFMIFFYVIPSVDISDSQADGSFCLGIKSCVIQHTFSYWKKISYLLDMQIPATSSFCNSSASICETILLITNKEKVHIERLLYVKATSTLFLERLLPI